MCSFETIIKDNEGIDITDLTDKLIPMIEDQLVEINGRKITVTEKGKPFVRNVCMAFDVRLKRNQPENQLFSMTV